MSYSQIMFRQGRKKNNLIFFTKSNSKDSLRSHYAHVSSKGLWLRTQEAD